MPYASINGTELYFTSIGQGPPCLVLHGGLGFDHTYLHPWLDPLSTRLRLIYYDHRGNGRSGRPSLSTITFEQLAADVEGLRAHLDHDRVDLIGHSVGGMVALEYGARYPGRINRLLLLNTAGAWDHLDEVVVNAKRKGATPDLLALLDYQKCQDDDYLREGMAKLAPLYFHRFDPAVFTKLFDRVIYSGKSTGRTGELLRNYNVLNRLGAITAPTLILTGGDDFVTPPSQSTRLHRAITGSDLILLNNSGHFPYVEEPDTFFPEVIAWLDKHGRSESKAF